MENIPVFNPASGQARVISSLFVAVLILCGVILAVMAGFVAYNLVRFRSRDNLIAGEPRQVFGNKGLEIVWTTVPFLLLVWIMVLTLRAMRDSNPPSTRTPDLVVIAHQWWWEVRYPKAGFTTANEIHIPVGRKWAVRLLAADVIHDFWVPALTRKEDMIPGQTNAIWLEADQPGTYLGSCAEYCGTEHAWMRFLVIAETDSQFAGWASLQSQPQPSPGTASEHRGLRLFEERTCANCHSIQGVCASTNAGPDLTRLASRRTLGAGVATNSPANLERWLLNPQAIKPGCRMPNLKLTATEAKDLAAYLWRVP